MQIDIRIRIKDRIRIHILDADVVSFIHNICYLLFARCSLERAKDEREKGIADKMTSENATDSLWHLSQKT